jgi:hypothetical protein
VFEGYFWISLILCFKILLYIGRFLDFCGFIDFNEFAGFL